MSEKVILCHCGKPLHYSRPEHQATVERMIAIHGPTVPVGDLTSGRTWKVDRHYIALHGLKGSDLPTLGFPEITSENPS
jgi:hypothetical protein